MNPNDPRIKGLAPLLRRVRRDVTAVKKADGTTAWTREPLTKELVAKHLNGGPARGVSPILEGQSSTLVGLLDFDSHGGETPWQGMVEAAAKVYETAALFGLRATAFRSSGGRGIHLIFLWDEPQDAASVRACLTDVLAACGFANGTKGVRAGQVEVFPKQNAVPFGGFGNQFILPLAGKSEMLDPVLGFEPVGKEAVCEWKWPASDPVPPVAAPDTTTGPQAPLVAGAVPMAVLKSALAAIPNSGDDAPDYDGWRDIIFGIHHATGGSAEGLALAIEFSARNPDKHNEKFLRERVWPYAGKRQGGKTARTVLARAREKGWQQDHADWFDDLDSGENGVENPVEKTGDGVNSVEGTSPGAGSSTLATAPPPALPPFRVNQRTGQVLADAPNLDMACADEGMMGGILGYDEFRDELMIDRSGGRGQWERFLDEDYFKVRVRLERAGFAPIGRELIRDAVHAVARRNSFDTAIEWLSRLEWDGVPRVERFLADYFQADDTPYTRAVSLYLWTALAGRVLQPGVKADMVPIAVGGQGVGKSTGIAAIAPNVDFFCEVSFHEREEDLARKMRGKIIAEIGELRGLHTKEIESIKAFATRTHEQWVPKYKEFSTFYPRRCVLFGSTNQQEFLADQTGNRRWLPFDSAANGPVKVSQIAADREQLWAEGAHLFKIHNVMWQAASRLAETVHDRYEMVDEWTDKVSEWMKAPGFGDDRPPCEREYLRSLDILTGALGFEAKSISRREEMRLAGLMKVLGYEKFKQRVDGRPVHVWKKVDGA